MRTCTGYHLHASQDWEYLCVGIELVSETAEVDEMSSVGVKPDLVQGIEFAYTLPPADLVVCITYLHQSINAPTKLLNILYELGNFRRHDSNCLTE